MPQIDYTSQPMNFENAANTRVIIGNISGALSTFGWVKSTDPGQINPATVAAPTGANQVLGYEIWRMNDSLQASAPVFLKIQYGSGSAASACPRLLLQVGTGSDGAGNLTGQRSQVFSTEVSNYTSSSITSHYFSGDSNRFAFNVFGNDTNAMGTLLFVLERAHNQIGEDVADGVLMVGNGFSQYLPFSGLVPPSYTHWNCVAPPSGTGALGNNVATFPVRCFTPGESSPFHGVLGFFAADLNNLNPVEVVGWDGVTRNYIPLSGNWSSPSYIAYGANLYMLMRHD